MEEDDEQRGLSDDAVPSSEMDKREEKSLFLSLSLFLFGKAK